MPTSNKPQFSNNIKNNRQVSMLGDICQIAMGQSPSSDTYTMNKAGVPFFQGNADFGEENPIPRIWCNKPIKIANENDILISVRAPIGSINIANRKCCIGRGLAKITPNICVYLRYLIWFLRSRTKFLQDNGTGTTFKAINKKQLETLPISLPNVNEQMQIGQVLDKLSSLINLKKKQYRVLDKLVKSQFVLMFGDAGNYYLHNKIVNITDVAKDIFAGGDKPKDFSSEQNDVYKHPVYSNGEKNSGLLCYSKTARVYDVALTVSARGTLGFSVIRNKPFTPVVRLITIIPNNKCNITYLKYCLDTVGFASSGTSQGQITVPDFKSRKIPLPSMDNQIQFENIIKRIDKSKFVIQQSIEKLELLKKSLMQQYFG